MIVIERMEQGSTAWHKARFGVLTASRVKELITATGKLSSQGRRLKYKLAHEAIAQESAEQFRGNYYTERGQALEQDAVAAFEIITDLKPQPVGLVYRNEIRSCGCSPDSLIADDDGNWIAGVEIKCPEGWTHLEYLDNPDDPQYVQQVQFSLWVTGLPVWYFMSYHPLYQPLLRKHTPDPAWQKIFDTHVQPFLNELHDFINEQRTSA